jgi:hypothetical protein
MKRKEITLEEGETLRKAAYIIRDLRKDSKVSVIADWIDDLADEHGISELCDSGCGLATGKDLEGVPLCDDCGLEVNLVP